MTTKADLVRNLRRQLRDFPERTRVTDAGGITAASTTITLPPGDTDRLFPRGGAFIEFDDGTDDRRLVTDADGELEQITVLAGQDGTTAADHDENTTIFVDPSWSYRELEDALSEIVGAELWPWVWMHKEFSIDTFETDGHYSPPAANDDIEQVVGVYQLLSGQKVWLEWEWVSPEMADDTNFPRGMLAIPASADTSTFYVAYRAKGTLDVDANGDLTNLSGNLQYLAVLGATAHLTMLSETGLVAPDKGKVAGGLQEGSRINAGLRLWERFERRRSTEKVNLEADEPA